MLKKKLEDLSSKSLLIYKAVTACTYLSEND